MALAYFPFYPNDWLGSNAVDILTLEQEGAYLRLLCRAWGCPDCTLPEDENVLMKWSKLSDAYALRMLLDECFERVDGGWRNPKLYKEFLKATDRHDKASKSASVRWSKVKDANAVPTQCEGNAKAMLTRTRTRTIRTFSPPTVDEVRAYCLERKNEIDPESFVAHYASKGWKVGNSPMKDWKSAMITWEKRRAIPGTPAPKKRREIPVVTVPTNWKEKTP